MTRSELAAELLRDCPEESMSDHQIIADAILFGHTLTVMLSMREVNNWPETYSWLKAEMPELTEE